jgi:small subunit ribosomal protein S17e
MSNGVVNKMASTLVYYLKFQRWREIMGNIRPNYIKALATQLIEEYGAIFGADFNQNKANVTKYTNIESKVIRNRVAGYIVRQIKTRQKRNKGTYV